METIHYKTISEDLYYEEMANGLKVYLLPKEGFSKTYGLFTTDFGSIDTTFVPLGESEMIKVPDGIAHFLEHKMFDMADGDATEKFARLGASTNAFTSSTRTAYLFNTTSNEKECVELLLDFVQELYLTPESVEKEKGIIGQEIKMYDDDPDWRCYFGSIQNLYQKHTVSVDIAGTVETVNSTDKETLEKCYNTFYHPSNMMLFVVGNIVPENMMSIIRNNQEKKSFTKQPEIVKEKIIEPKETKTKEDVLKMDVVMSKIYLSIKVNDILTEPKALLKRELAMTLLQDLLFSRSASLYEKWTKEGIINSSFGSNFIQEKDYCFIQLGGDTPNPDVLKEKMYELIEALPQYEFDIEEFERSKKKNVGSLISVFNSPENIASMFSRYYFSGNMFFDIIDVLEEVQYEDVLACRDLFNKENATTFIVLPK